LSSHARYAFPRVSRRFLPVWRRNVLVWRKLALPSMLGNLGEPLIYMLGLGYGLGALLPDFTGMPYIVFIASGMACSSTMNSATFETLYSSFSRMHVQKTWDAILNAPMNLDDVVLGELVWAVTKAFLSGTAILVVSVALGLVKSPLAIAILLVLPLIGLTFGALGLVVTAISPSYDFFMYYFTLFITPMTILCGVFFPIEQLPAFLQGAAQLLPLTHAVQLVRPLFLGEIPQHVVVHVAVLLFYSAAGFYAATVLFRRRLLK
jgi:lipooligosaccharide transport system permease protein